MPKIKTHKATAKRFRVTGTGKIKRTRQGKNHFHRNRHQRVLNAQTKPEIVESGTYAKKIKALAPYLDNK
jgi:large subunit ribosomal protein L35